MQRNFRALRRISLIGIPARTASPGRQISVAEALLTTLMIGLHLSACGLCPQLGVPPVGHPPVAQMYRWASQAQWPAEPVDFAAALRNLDFDDVRQDLKRMFRNSQPAWPALRPAGQIGRQASRLAGLRCTLWNVGGISS